ncbi:MAG: porin [Hydrogenophaga sp.]|uniref:porin n=1 Tax=Hydrogenophaga sp. TaxID=1904254 RepID=UPI0027324AD2|nr:porin [Hydrogenophaga sp.]MDP3352059.1 porin [Hydrogenophaga sp.]
MKKTLIALAAVAATSASFAQSTVTLSGTVDVGLEKRFSGDPMRMTPNRNGTSNWTLSGAEDLGGGLKAVFQISTSFNSDTGTVSSTDGLGNNGMFVGLTGGFGTLRAGRPVNTLYGNAMFANGTKGVSLHDSNSVVSGNATASAKTSGASSSVYVPNAVQYHTPRFGGVQVQLEYAPSESAAVGNKAGTGVAVRYDGGPLSVSFTNYTGAKAATSTLKSVNQIAAAYDFSVAKLFFTYRDQGGLASDQDTSYALGVTAPVGPGALYAAYNVNEQTGSDGRTIIAGYKYSLSKRTQAYVNVARRNAAWLDAAVTAAGGKANSSSTGFGFGLQHNF